ncbi:hypothetical protein ACFLJY_002100 [Vibrio alginolyticus]
MKSTASLKIIIAKQIFDTSMIPNSNFEWGKDVFAEIGVSAPLDKMYGTPRFASEKFK